MVGWKNQGDIEIDSRWGWMHYRCPVQSVEGTKVTMQQPCYWNANLHEGQEIQNPTWIENAYELLDSPGEWYLDKSSGDVYYLPQPGQSPTTATVVVPQVQDLVDVTGTLSDPVQNIRFDGITFSYSTWLDPSSDDGMVEGQAGFRIVGTGHPNFDETRLTWLKTPGAVNVGYSRNISFTGSTFTHLGAVGLNLNTGSQGTTIRGNIFRDVAATGIQVGGTDIIDHHPDDARAITKDNLVSNNLITKAAADYSGSLAIVAGYTEHTVIEHNKIYDLPYSGISVGWGWGNTDPGGDTNYPGNFGIPIYDTPTTSKNNVIRDNAISDIMKHQADGGAIYTLGMQPGSVVSGNYIKDTPSPAYGAIYHDEGSRVLHHHPERVVQHPGSLAVPQPRPEHRCPAQLHHPAALGDPGEHDRLHDRQQPGRPELRPAAGVDRQQRRPRTGVPVSGPAAHADRSHSADRRQVSRQSGRASRRSPT